MTKTKKKTLNEQTSKVWKLLFLLLLASVTGLQPCWSTALRGSCWTNHPQHFSSLVLTLLVSCWAANLQGDKQTNRGCQAMGGTCIHAFIHIGLPHGFYQPNSFTKHWLTLGYYRRHLPKMQHRGIESHTPNYVAAKQAYYQQSYSSSYVYFH